MTEMLRQKFETVESELAKSDQAVDQFKSLSIEDIVFWEEEKPPACLPWEAFKIYFKKHITTNVIFEAPEKMTKPYRARFLRIVLNKLHRVGDWHSRGGIICTLGQPGNLKFTWIRLRKEQNIDVELQHISLLKEILQKYRINVVVQVDNSRGNYRIQMQIWPSRKYGEETK